MNMNRMLSLFLSCATLALTAFLFLGCELDSSESVVRDVAVNFTGYYDKINDDTAPPFVSPKNSGGEVTFLNLLQTGDSLEATDNHGIIFRGSIGSVEDTTASFTLEGSTTAGQDVTITGQLNGDASTETATMKGTWIEPNVYAAVNGDAKINPIPTNQPSPGPTNDLKLVTTTSTLQPTQSATLTASGGSTPYNWSISANNLGALAVAPSGNSAEYQANSAVGTNTITVTDSASATVFQTIIQPGL